MASQRVEAPTVDQMQAWLAQLRDDHKEQEKEVRRCESELTRAKGNLNDIERDIKAAESILKALSEAGHR